MKSVVALSFFAMQCATATNSFAETAVNQNGSCNQSNSGSGNNVLNCYIYPQPRKRFYREPTVPQPPAIRLSSPRCEPDQETTVKKPTPIVADPWSGVRDGVLMKPGDSIKVLFQLGDMCHFHYCSPLTGSCFNASVNVNALLDRNFLDKAKAVYEICKANTDQDRIVKCMQAHGLRKPN